MGKGRTCGPGGRDVCAECVFKGPPERKQEGVALTVAGMAINNDQIEALRMALQMGYPLNTESRLAALRLLVEHAELKREVALLRAQLAALDALMAEAEQAKAWRPRAEKLWKLLDDIDTLDDACRSDDAAFRDATRRIQQKRHAILTSLDGYTLVITGAEPAGGGGNG